MHRSTSLRQEKPADRRMESAIPFEPISRQLNCSPADFYDITETRVMLECEALHQSIALGDEIWESELLATYRRLAAAEQEPDESGAAEEWHEHHRAFHEALISACPSHWLRHFVSLLCRQADGYRLLSRHRKALPPSVHAEHRALCEAALARKTEVATGILARHIRANFQALR